jgi:uncharacterized damage-inducible protein DinB
MIERGVMPMEIDMPRVFDYLTAARGRLLGWVRDLEAERPGAYAQSFPFGLGSIRATLLHVAAAEWAYVERLAGRDFPLTDSPFTAERLPEFEPFVRAWDAQAARTGPAIKALGDPARPVEFISRVGPAPMRARTTAGEITLHMVLHEVHHRAQVMAMLRRCGVRAENLDYSFLAFVRTPLGR